jgi:hypothetical protein
MMLSVAEIAVCVRQARRDAIRRRVYEDVYSRPIFTPVEPIIRNARLELRYRELLAEPIHARTSRDVVRVRRNRRLDHAFGSRSS